MPTVHRWRGHRFYFYSHEPNEPPHVHVDRAGSSAKFWLDPVRLARNIGFTPPQLRALAAEIERTRAALLESSHGYFGGQRR